MSRVSSDKGVDKSLAVASFSIFIYFYFAYLVFSPFWSFTIQDCVIIRGKGALIRVYHLTIFTFFLFPPPVLFLCISYGPPSRTHSYHSGTSSGRFTGDSTVGFSPERQPPNVSNMTECTSIFRPKKPRKNGKITNKEPICQY